MTIFKAMGRETTSEQRRRETLDGMLDDAFGTWPERKTTVCEKCGRRLEAGDWPWCSGSAAQHER